MLVLYQNATLDSVEISGKKGRLDAKFLRKIGKRNSKVYISYRQILKLFVSQKTVSFFSLEVDVWC